MPDDNKQSESMCDTYFPKTIAVIAGVTGAVEGFIADGVVGAIPSAAFQTVGGYHIGKWACHAITADEPSAPGQTPNPPPATPFIGKR